MTTDASDNGKTPPPEGSIYDLYREVLPAVSWPTAHRPDGTVFNLSMEDFFCSPEYEDVNALVVVRGTGWCTTCSQFTEIEITQVPVMPPCFQKRSFRSTNMIDGHQHHRPGL